MRIAIRDRNQESERVSPGYALRKCVSEILRHQMVLFLFIRHKKDVIECFCRIVQFKAKGAEDTGAWNQRPAFLHVPLC